MSRRRIKGVLDNFLGTFISRNSDYEGYWLFGKLVDRLTELKIDLLESIPVGDMDCAATRTKQIASQTFNEQMSKASLELPCLREATLEIRKRTDERRVFVNGRARLGIGIGMLVKAVLTSGKVYEMGMIIYAAPHDPEIEICSTRPSQERK